jgi:pyruvate-formate lyase
MNEFVEFLRGEAMRDPSIAKAPAPLREGRIVAFVLERLPLDILPGTQLAGAFGADWGSPCGPGADYGDRFQRWVLTEKQRFVAAPPEPLTPWQVLAQRFHCMASDGGHAHTTVQFDRVITGGLIGILADIERESTGSDSAKRDHLMGMQVALNGLIRLASRFAALAEARATSVTDSCEQRRLRGLAERCRWVPAKPARSCREALQALWLIQLGIGISERSSASLSLGRLDQYLYPLYKKERADGATDEDLADAIADFFRILNTYGDAACTVNLGPASRHFNSANGAPAPDATTPAMGDVNRFNPLSRLIVDVVKRLRLPSPILAMRIQEDTSPEDFDVVADPVLFEIGQPTFYGEEACRKALRRRGVPPDQVADWAVNSCMGLVMPGAEWANMWGSVINVLLPLELALNGGRPLHDKLPFQLATAVPSDYCTFGDLLDVVDSLMNDLVTLCIRETEIRTRRRGEESPNPFVSALLDDCIRRGRDRLLGGCRYQTVTVEAFGLINASDALQAVRQLVYEERRFALAEMVEAVKGDFVGRPDILHAVSQVAKYGNGDPEVDALAREVADRFAAAVVRHSRGPVCYAPSFHTLAEHIPAGAKIGASLDGRREGQPLAKNIGTSSGRARQGHTALILSAAAIDQAAFFGGQALDLSIDPSVLRGQEGRRKFQALLQTYFKLGGLEVQVNGVSARRLRQAMADPEAHHDVLVRRAGFTTRYVTMPRLEQQELIGRFQEGM